MATREVIWVWLSANPGRTAFEIARGCLRKTGPTGGSVQAGSVRALLLRMEAAGQVRREHEYRAQQGKTVSLWHAVPGAFETPSSRDEVA